MSRVYVTQFAAGDKSKQVRVDKFDHLPEFSHVYYTCSDCGEENYSCLSHDIDISKAHFGNRDGKPICLDCWRKIMQEERERVASMFEELKTGERLSITYESYIFHMVPNGKRTAYFRRTENSIMVSGNDRQGWRRLSMEAAIELWRGYEKLQLLEECV